MAQRITPAEEQISKLLAQIYELEQGLAQMAGDAAAQQLLQNRMRELMEGVQALRQAAAAFPEAKLPQPALRYIDEGGHPDDYVKGLVQAALRDNQRAKGAVHAIARLRDKLLAGAEAAFPDAVAAYRAVAGPLPSATAAAAPAVVPKAEPS